MNEICFSDLAELKNVIAQKEIGNIVVGYENMPDYAGMVRYIGIVFNLKKGTFELNVEWIAMGLDWYGDTLVQSIVHTFKSIDELISSLESKFQISIDEIPKKYKFEQDLFPNPLKSSDQKEFFEQEWKRFQNDFSNGKIS